MKINNKSILKITTFILLLLSLFTLTQAYYSAYIHIALFLLCFLSCGKEHNLTLPFVASSIMICFVFVIMAIFKCNGTTMDHVGFYLHYITWPVLFICVARNYSTTEVKRLLYFIIAICIIGDILSLIQLSINPEISRLLAGTHLEGEKIAYYKMGVGGYGYVFAMAFFTFGIVRWLITSKSKLEKVYLSIFLVVNSMFILYASYTTAIVISIILAGLALVSGMKRGYKSVVIIIAILLILVLGRPLLELCYNIANDLELEWVARRFGQLIYAQENDDMSSLRRFGLYKASWDTFIANPLFGADEFGGHSQVLDSFAQYGVFAILLIIFIRNCKKLCDKLLIKSDLSIYTLIFFIFACIDTCSVMQLPVVVFFAVPLISYYLKMEGNNHESRNYDISLGS